MTNDVNIGLYFSSYRSQGYVDLKADWRHVKMPLSENWSVSQQRRAGNFSCERTVSQNEAKDTHAQESQKEVDVHGHSVHM